MKANKQHEGTEHVVNIFHLNVWILGKRNSFISMKKGVTCSKGGLKRWQPVAANLPENQVNFNRLVDTMTYVRRDSRELKRVTLIVSKKETSPKAILNFLLEKDCWKKEITQSHQEKRVAHWAGLVKTIRKWMVRSSELQQASGYNDIRTARLEGTQTGNTYSKHRRNKSKGNAQFTTWKRLLEKWNHSVIKEIPESCKVQQYAPFLNDEGLIDAKERIGKCLVAVSIILETSWS